MAHWRPARPDDDEAVIAMSLNLYAHAPPAGGISAAQILRTLETFRHQPVRGRALVLDDQGERCGYAFLVSFWSNELGGEICTIDELYVVPDWRGHGWATVLLDTLRSGDGLWPIRPVALELEVAPANVRARALYERAGFRPRHNATLRLMIHPSDADPKGSGW